MGGYIQLQTHTETCSQKQVHQPCSRTHAQHTPPPAGRPPPVPRPAPQRSPCSGTSLPGAGARLGHSGRRWRRGDKPTPVPLHTGTAGAPPPMRPTRHNHADSLSRLAGSPTCAYSRYRLEVNDIHLCTPHTPMHTRMALHKNLRTGWLGPEGRATASRSAPCCTAAPARAGAAAPRATPRPAAAAAAPVTTPAPRTARPCPGSSAAASVTAGERQTATSPKRQPWLR